MLPSLKCKVWPYFDSHIDGRLGAHLNFVRIFFFGKEGNTTNKSLIFLIFLSCIKYQMIYRISIILYRYTYCIEKFDRYAALVIGGELGDRSGGDRASHFHSTVSRCRYHYYVVIYVSNMYKWNSKRR